MWMLALGKAITIPVLNEQKMIELGASLLGELIVFSIGAGVVINELYKASQKEAKKEAGRRQEINQFKTELEDLYVQVQEQQALIQKIIRLQGNNGGEGGVSKRMEDEVLVQTMKLETAISTFLKRLLFK
ncbi:hypothetical protein PPYR_00355 [Photinus pyralis]|uniref:OPA3-like protein n=1 Tax=Photinus pyralis TaxID=7054 RepID=A0A5N4B1B7_PHOPY|nr:putative OPA3-like protein CG13603 [Photinus pyralis]KAB0803385.1 hypothetical protein PPYR_00355 [Photinus pyralis]